MKRSKQQPVTRDLSWLSFNSRVMQEAKDPGNSLFDRLRFLGIFSDNQDEFFRVRVATLNRMVHLRKSDRMHLEREPGKILARIQDIVLRQQREFDMAFSSILNGLGQENIFIKDENKLTPAQEAFVQKCFDQRIRTEIVPLIIESIPQMPLLNDKSIYLSCILGSTSDKALLRYALIEVPSENLGRFVILPSSSGRKDIILLEDIIRHNLPTIFGSFGFDRFASYLIKVTRDAEYDLDNDINTDMVAELMRGVKNRKKGKAMRFVYDRAIDPSLLEYLTRRLGLTKKDNLVPGGRIHNFKDFMDFPPSVFRQARDPKARRRPFPHPDLRQPCRIMGVLDKKDVLLHFPYHSFDTLIDLLREAAIDPNVLDIKITCYRLAKNSKIINALINAARNGKRVTTMMEIRARFDEEANLKWKAMLEEEGVNVVMGFRDMKIHAKLCLITKREFGQTKQYGFIGTGNFNESTARQYSDECLLTSDKKLLEDVDKVFAVMEGSVRKLSALSSLKQIAVSPLTTRSLFLRLIDREIQEARKNKPASIIIKLNRLVDEELIKKLYEAAGAGVALKLIVRDICCMLTERPEFKVPIQAISIVDKYLEHARIFAFHNKGKPLVYLSSADWMVRNMDHRIEVTCPVRDPELARELVDILNIQLSENVKGRLLDNGQSNRYVRPGRDGRRHRSQEETCAYLQRKAASR